MWIWTGAPIDNSLRLFCYCHFVIKQDWSRSARSQKHLFHAPSSQGRSSVPSSVLLCAGNLINVRSTRKLSSISCAWMPNTIYLSDRNNPLWECWYNLSNLTNQRVYQELVYRNGSFKEMITGSAAPSCSPQFPSVLFSCLCFLNSADPTISEPGTGYTVAKANLQGTGCQLDLLL